MRSLFFLTGLVEFNNWYDDTGIRKPEALGFIWTYPLINFVVISYTVSSHWVYDLMTLMYAERANPLLLRRQMVIFVIAIAVFIVIMYLVYMFSLPASADGSDLKDIFYFLAIFEWIVAAIILCSFCLYYKRIHQ